jgi:hypothetical protein
MVKVSHIAVVLVSTGLLAVTGGAGAADGPQNGPAPVAPVAPVAPTAPASAPTAPKQTTLAVAITKLRSEALESWGRGKGWPRDKSDFAASMNWTIPADGIITALGRPLDRNPAIDAYIKWQLLSFGPDLSNLSSENFARIFTAAPHPLDAPVPRTEKRGSDQGAMMFFGRQTAYLADLDPVVGKGVVAYRPRMGVVGQGVGVGNVDERVDLLQTVERANRSLIESRKLVQSANASVLAYRAALIERAPDDDAAMKMGVLLKDVRDRVAAGDDSFADAMRRLMDEAPGLTRSPDMTDEARARLTEWATALAKMKTTVVTRVGLDGMDFQYDGRIVAVSEADVKRLLGLLQAAAP